jgi:hypothetical protein
VTFGCRFPPLLASHAPSAIAACPGLSRTPKIGSVFHSLLFTRRSRSPRAFAELCSRCSSRAAAPMLPLLLS